MAENENATQQQEPQDQQPAQQQEPQQPELKDRHGQPAISKGKYERDLGERDKTIAELRSQLDALTEQAGKAEQALADVDALRTQLADEKLDHALELAGCVNPKAAKAVLDDYAGDVARLREACPYLFQTPKQTGSTGARPGGAPDSALESRLDRAFGLKRKK